LFDDIAAPFDMLAEDIVRIVINKIDFRADIDPFPSCANDERGLTALSDGEDNVFGGNTKVANLFLAELGEVLKAFDGFDESKIAASHDTEGAVLEVFG